MNESVLRSVRRYPLRWLSGVVLALMGLSLLTNCITRPPDFVPREEVWAHVQRRAAENGLDPHFVYAIVKAESTFNANASNRDARGLMQLRRPAWETVSDRPFRHAWRWRVNIDNGVAYLVHLRDFLEARHAFSYPRLAAAYRYGPNALERAGFDLGGLPEPRNQVYHEIFRGNLSPVAAPH